MTERPAPAPSPGESRPPIDTGSADTGVAGGLGPSTDALFSLTAPARRRPNGPTSFELLAAVGAVSAVVDAGRAEGDAVALGSAVTALEDLRRLESWVAWARHRVAAAAASAAQAAHGRWVDAHPRWFDDESEPSRGLSRSDRLAVGHRSGVAEIACALRISEDAVTTLLRSAELLAERLPDTDAALRTGRISGPAAAAIAGATAEYADRLEQGVDPGMEAALEGAIDTTEQALLPAAERGESTTKLNARARRVREACHPVAFAQRHREACAERYVRIFSRPDGMATLTALLPAAVAYRVDGRLSSLARQLRATLVSDGGEGTDTTTSAPHVGDPGTDAAASPGPVPADDRTLAQLRADVLVDLLGGLGGTGITPDGCSPPADSSNGSPPRESGESPLDGVVRRTDDGPVPGLTLTVSAETLLGGDDPGILGMFGPVAAADARRLAALAPSFTLAVTSERWTGARPGSSLSRCAPGPGSYTGPPTGSASRPDLARPPDAALAPGGAGPAPDGDPPPESGAAPPFGSDPLGMVVPVTWTAGEQYRLPRALHRALAIRDVTCRFPGCRRTAESCDVDHVIAWADGGRSTSDNLAHLCRTHHVLKHHSGWSVEAVRGAVPGAASRAATLEWTSPAGRRYLTDPEPPPF
ncbi:HNH endonuclease signature motif containing protein [Tersicoccus solisilvae]|uniref:HNH endonuclease signature motif containing protein n=1 Tax=Tersicoccus solisilvae TaxID=1882339 RepID=UPI001E5266A8|nr:HNH endonuclease signature motif containing protein [Tersicoccus solisilvae]